LISAPGIACFKTHDKRNLANAFLESFFAKKKAACEYFFKNKKALKDIEIVQNVE
jgi:hypothetical protein